MLELFLKTFTISRKQNFNTEEKTAKLYKKENFKPQIKLMTENQKNELYELENKQVETFLTMPQNFLQSA